MKVAVVAPLAAPIGEPEPYGNHVFLIDLARGLRRRGHDVAIYAASGSRVPGVEVVGCHVEASARGAFIHADGAFASGDPGMRRSFERLFERLRADAPDVVSQHAFDAEAFELAQGLPVVHTLHLPPIVPAVIDACRRARAPLVAVSHAASAQWRSAGVETVVIPNGVPDRAIPPAGVFREAIVAGRICPEKGTAVAIRAGLAAGFQVRVVGGVYDPAYFQREVQPLLGPCVQVESSVPRRLLFDYFARSAVCLMPIEWDEPFGLVAAEAQVAGCPVAGYARGALPELVEQGVSGILVPPGDEARLVQAIGEACALDRYRVRRSGRARLLFDASLGRYEALLRKVAKGRHAACLPESMDTERRERTSPTDRWPFDPMPPGDHEPAHLPGGTATQMHEKDKARPKPKAKPVDPPPQAT